MAWYNSSWSRRKKITLTGGSSGAQTNYPLMLTITWATGMQADFDDLRFTQSDGTTLIDAWLETHTASSSATVWVKFPTTPANTVTQDYYMYYGNSGAASDWNDSTFTFIDEFNRSDSATVGNGWTETGTACITSNALTCSTNVLSTVTRNFAFSGGPYAIDAKIKTPSLSKLAYVVMSDNSHTSYLTMAQSSAQVDRIQSYLPTNTLLDPFSINHYYVLTNARVNGTTFDYFVDYGNTGTSFTNQTPTTVSTNDRMIIYIGYQTKYVCDWTRIRKYAQNPATYGFGSAELEYGIVSIAMRHYRNMRNN